MPTRVGEHPPGPKGRWLVGNSYDYDQDRIGFLMRCQAEYGDLFSFSPNTVVACHPDLIDDLFKRSNEDFLAEEPILASERDQRRLVDGIDGWMRSRAAAWRGLTRPAVRAHGRRMAAIFDDTLRKLEGQEFDVVTVMRRYSARAVADFCFGPDCGDVLEATDRRSGLAVKFMNSNFTFPKWLPLPSVRRAVRAEDQVEQTIRAHIRTRRSRPRETPSDLLDLLLADADAGLDEDELATVLGATMLAAFGSPGAAMAWLLREMVRHPGAQERLRQEALSAIAETGGVDDDRRLPYSRAFVNEVMRLHPPTWLMGRIVRRRCELGGWWLEPGTHVMFSPYLLHRDPRWWSDPDQFRPERWLESTRTQVPHTYIPFGAGPRICLGIHLGLYQMVTGAAQLAASYEVASPRLDKTPPAPDVVLLPRDFRASITRLPVATADAVTTSGPR